MKYLRSHREQCALIGGVIAPLLVAGGLVAFRSTFANTAAALLLVAVITAVAVLGTRPAGVVASISAALWFDFFLTAPYERLTIEHRRDLEITVCLLFVGLVVTELAERSRRFRQSSIDESQHVARIHRIASSAANADGPASDLIAEVETSLMTLLHLRSCYFERGSRTDPATWIDLDGTVVHGVFDWPAHDMGIPGKEVEFPVRWQGRTSGRFVMVPTPTEPVEREARLVAAVLVDIVGAALATSDLQLRRARSLAHSPGVSPRPS